MEKRILTTGGEPYGTLSVEVLWHPTPNHSALKRPPRLIVLHSAECGESSNAAEALAKWGAGEGRPRASWHFAVDNDSITQSVAIDRASWHAGPVNGYSIGIEQAGRARQSREQWFDDYSRAMLENTARLVALLCDTLTIGVGFVEGAELKRWHDEQQGAWGITTHREVSRGWRHKGGHTDPGEHYPIDWLLERVDSILSEAGLKY